GEYDVGGADGFGCRLDGAEDRHHAGEELADDLGAPDAEATDRDIVGGDAAFGDDPCRMRGERGLDHLDDRGGDGAGDGKAVVGGAAHNECVARVSSASPPGSRGRLVNSSTSEVARASATCLPMAAT